MADRINKTCDLFDTDYIMKQNVTQTHHMRKDGNNFSKKRRIYNNSSNNNSGNNNNNNINNNFILHQSSIPKEFDLTLYNINPLINAFNMIDNGNDIFSMDIDITVENGYSSQLITK